MTVNLALHAQPFPAAAGVAPLGERADRFLDGSGAAPVVVLLPDLSFVMGAHPGEPAYARLAAPHVVELTRYAIGRDEVTTAQFCVFLNAIGGPDFDASALLLIESPKACRIERRGGRFVPLRGTEEEPVSGVTWIGARKYCQWLSIVTGHHYELPTAAQWEAAARAGTTTRYPWGDVFDAEGARSCLSGDGPVRAGSTPPNAWGLRDMLGNVWEWVLDCFELDFYYHSPRRDPLLLDDTCLAPEIRGGSFRDGAAYCSPGYRANTFWNIDADNIGFRVARELDAADLPGGGS